MVIRNTVLLCGAASLSMWAASAVAQASQIYQPPVDSGPQDKSSTTTNADAAAKAKRDQAAKPSRKGPMPATSADLVAGSQIFDKKGVAVGTVDRVDSDGVVVATATGRVKVPLEAFGKDAKGLVFSVTKAEFDQIVAGAGSAPAG